VFPKIRPRDESEQNHTVTDGPILP
jgi:hypothetical protein